MQHLAVICVPCQARTRPLQAELQKQVEQSRALAEAEGRIKENRANEDINRRQLAQRLEAERQKLMEAIDSTFRCDPEGNTL